MSPQRSDNPTERAWNAFVDFLRQHGARVTHARRMVLEQAMSRKDHFRADDLAGDLAAGPSRVSRGTIYRTLALMVEAGLVREIRDGDVHAHYEWVFGRPEHEHMVCDACGAFVEFTDPQIAEQIELACERRGFRRRAHRVVVFGLCEKCRQG